MAGQESEFVNVSEEELAGFYEMIPVDGTLPIDRFALSNLWTIRWPIAPKGAANLLFPTQTIQWCQCLVLDQNIRP